MEDTMGWELDICSEGVLQLKKNTEIENIDLCLCPEPGHIWILQKKRKRKEKKKKKKKKKKNPVMAVATWWREGLNGLKFMAVAFKYAHENMNSNSKKVSPTLLCNVLNREFHDYVEKNRWLIVGRKSVLVHMNK